MATFSAVNTALSPQDISLQGEERTPTTPKPGASQQPVKDAATEESTPSTPTRHSFAGVAGQRPLPDEPLTPAQSQDKPEESLKRDSSHRSASSHQSGGAEDVEMGEGDDDVGQEEGDSDNESVNSDSQRPSKKKKGQRFFCTEFPPCQLSFTRSEHLARHIRYVELRPYFRY